MNNRALMLASVASMIDLFNRDNLLIWKNKNITIDVAANFQKGSITSQERVNSYKEELKSQNINIIDVPIPRSIFRIKDIIKSYKIVKQHIEERDYRIVHCHSPIGGVIARLACRKARKNGTKLVYTAHGFHFFKGAPVLNWIIFYPIEKICSCFTDLLLTINREDYERAKKWNTCRVEYVPGIGVHAEEFRSETINRNQLRRELGFSDDDIIFMSTGQISVRKNHEVVIKAIAKINNPKIKYLVIGAGELMEQHCELTKKLGIKNRVVFAGYRGDVKQLLHIVDGFVFPSLQEGLPVALMEAMSVGLPVVCSRIRGNVDLIEHGKGGFIYDCKDIDGFAEGMKTIAKGETKNMGKINMKTIKEFDVQVVNQYMENIYEELLKN